MIKRLTCVIGTSLLLCLAGCGPADYGFVAPERYMEPPPIALTAQEQGVLDVLVGETTPEAFAVLGTLTDEQIQGLTRFADPARSALTKVMRQKNAWRAIVREHNKIADERIRDLLKKSGVKVRTLELEPQKKF